VVRETAAQFGANGFEVLKGKIGNINITSSAIYSGSNGVYHNAYNSGNSGFYLGSDGKFGVGNGSSYIRYDGNKISIAVTELTIGNTGIDDYINNRIPSDGGGGGGSSEGGSTSGDTTSTYLTYR